MRRTTGARILATAAALALIPILGLAATANAAARDGVCDPGEFCYYWNLDQSGSLSDFTGSVYDYRTSQPSCYDFKSPGGGQGFCIKNNAASVWNRASVTVRVFFNSGYAGEYQDIAPGARANLNATLRDNNASHLFLNSIYFVGNDYPYPAADWNNADAWKFKYRNCTSFAAWTINSRLHIAFNNSYKRVTWGDAGHWATAASDVGIPVTSTPRVGDIAVRTTGTYGHVAYVTKVNSDGTFEVDEYNHVVSHEYAHRTASVGTASNNFNLFIHFV